MIKCPNGCEVRSDAYVHTCRKHAHAIKAGRKFKCKIKNCQLTTKES